ncbi:hypothetical protein ACFPM0_32735 [Pseudonocardia sulfidoxydans]|uniref:hypothetical protein n=1 Tax=Pseudonocardia sulfidoxydans TaxID=54011 RepID=UPI003618FC23
MAAGAARGCSCPSARAGSARCARSCSTGRDRSSVRPVWCRGGSRGKRVVPAARR